MVRTLSVKETAQVLGISVRTVQYRLQQGSLKGMRTANQYGVKEWRVWPNKEILERLGGGKPLEEYSSELGSREFMGGDSSAVVDCEEIEQDEVTVGDFESPIRTVIRELTQQFAEQLGREREIVLQLKQDLEDKDRQLKLLPDLEKQAEDRRRETELKELEAIALRKQIAALQEAQQSSSVEDSQLIERLNQLENEVVPQLQNQLEQERTQKEDTLTEFQRQQVLIEKQQEEAEASKRRVEDLERTLAEKENLAAEELARLRQEKDAQAQVIQEQLISIANKLQKSQIPWWKRWFGSFSMPDAT